jgi:hypothetical protein
VEDSAELAIVTDALKQIEALREERVARYAFRPDAPQPQDTYEPVEKGGSIPSATVSVAGPGGGGSIVANAAPAKEVTSDDIVTAFRAFLKAANSTSEGVKLLSEFGVIRALDLKPEQRADFLARITGSSTDNNV